MWDSIRRWLIRLLGGEIAIVEKVEIPQRLIPMSVKACSDPKCNHPDHRRKQKPLMPTKLSAKEQRELNKLARYIAKHGMKSEWLPRQEVRDGAAARETQVFKEYSDGPDKSSA